MGMNIIALSDNMNPLLFSFRAGSIQDRVSTFLTSVQEISLNDLYYQFPKIKNSTLRSALVRDGRFRSIGYGVWSRELPPEEQYVEAIHTKHIVGTNKSEKQRAFSGLDVEFICRGLAPSEKTANEIDQVVNPMLLEVGVETLISYDIFITVDELEFNVIGTEITNNTTDRYNSRWEVEVHFTNKQGYRYVWENFFNVFESDWQ